jgi:hypothetical protein
VIGDGDIIFVPGSSLGRKERKLCFKKIVGNVLVNCLTTLPVIIKPMMSRSSYKVYETGYPYFMTSSFVEGIPIFADPDAAMIVFDSLIFLQTDRKVRLYAHVLMENHFHIIVRGENLSEKMRHFKSYTAKRIIDIFKQK